MDEKTLIVKATQYFEKDDWGDDLVSVTYSFELNGERVYHSLHMHNCWECPEDATFSRDLGSFLNIPDVIEKIGKLFKEGKIEDIKVVYEEKDAREDD